MKKIVGRDVLLHYPKFSEGFIIHVDARKMHTRREISSKWEFRCLLLTQVNPCLINYTTTVRKLFIIVENLRKNSVPIY